jgi:energy-coupling factor transporter transmembrane protein EcfT
VIAIGAALALVAGGKPTVHLGSLKVGFGGLNNFVRFTMVGVDILAGAALLGWTTPLADLSPALGRLLGPLRHVRLPVDELVGAVALSIRCLPLLLEEVRVLRAARRARRPAEARSFKELGDEAVELVFGALANAIRRAREMAEAIEARGGVPTVAPEKHPFALVDTVALVVSVMAVIAMAVLR